MGEVPASFLQSGQQIFAAFFIKVDEHVFLAGEVIEDGHPCDVCCLQIASVRFD